MNYTGPSMNPTLKAGDGLSVIPYENRKIHIGDVVVFQSPGGSHNVVHRVVAVESNGVRTRGDNSLNVDSWVLRPEDIMGRVVSVKRKNKNIMIRRGIWGRISASTLWILKQINLTASRILHPAYHALVKSGIFRKCLHFFPKTRVLSFNRPEGKEFHLIMANRVIGRRLPGNDGWQIMRPFRLFVDEAALPKKA